MKQADPNQTSLPVRTRQRLVPGDAVLHTTLVLVAGLAFFPFVFMVITSLKTNEQFLHHFWGIPSPLEPESYATAWANYALAWTQIRRYVLNSALVSSVSVSGVVFVACLSAYAFARHRFPGSQAFFYGIISLLMVPAVLTLISQFMWMKQFPFAGGNDWLGRGGQGLLDSRLGLILPYVAGGQVFAILVLRSFIAGLPEDLFEAARLDGAGELRILRSIVVPLCRPVIGAIAIMNLIAVWNDYVWPLIIISDDARRTLPIGLAFFRGQHGTTYGPLMAGYTLSSLPLLILFLFTMRSFISGLTSGALKT